MKVKVIKANLSETSVTVRVNNEELVKLILELQAKDRPIILDYLEEQLFWVHHSNKESLKELFLDMLDTINESLVKDLGDNNVKQSIDVKRG